MFRSLLGSMIPLFAAGCLLSACTVRTYAADPATAQGSASGSVRASGSVQAQGGAVTTENDSPGMASGGGGTVECHGGDNLVLQDRVIDATGNAVEAHGGCNLLLVRCKVHAGRSAIAAHGGSNVVVQDSELHGAHAALELHGSSNVQLVRTRLEGRIEKHGGSQLHDGGGNSGL
jgi:hypothetical protein